MREAGKADQLTGSARFTSVWLKQGQDWLLSDVLSYDHQPAEAEPQAALPAIPLTSTSSTPTTPSSAVPVTPAAPQAASQATSQVPALVIETLLKQQHVPALGLGIVKNGVLDSVQVYGELSPGQAAPQNTLFKVASLTKPIVTLLTLRLVAEGKLTLDEPLAVNWVDPDLQADPRHLLLTPRLVLTHQTGFANWRYLEQDKKLRFQFQPGSKHQYSGEGFEYLRRALEHKFGQPLEALAQQYVFAPAGMTDTHFWWTPEVDESRYARNHDVNGELLPLEKYYKANAAANLITTVSDYSKFLVFVLAQQQAMPQLYSAMVQPQISLQPHHAFGLGFEIFSDFSEGESALLHTGRDPGVSTAAVFFPESRNGYVIFMNGDNSMPVLEQLLPQLYLGAELWQRR
ncbi:MAG: beta-lactamase family protein [Gammaproteobacteria bacterium]|nr:beta-lactamase family protein [Gammaproteobacteria bacterium]